MKRFFTTTLASAIMMAAATTAFAASGSTTTDTGANISVNAKYSDTVTTPDVISAQVEWGAMEFTYVTGGSKKWNAQEHEYQDDNTSASWSAVGNTVTITNHSNVDVKAGFAYTPIENYKLTGTFSYDKTADETGKIELSKGVEGQKDKADHVTATLTLGGTLESSVTTSTQVGTITVTIEKK